MTETSTSRAREALGVASEPGKALTPLDKRISETRAMEAAFADAMASGLSPQTLMRDAITALRNVPDLAETDKTTFFGAVMTCAQLGLRPNVGSLGHGWILPFNDRRNNRKVATWVLGYQGMVELGYGSGLITKMNAHTIYSNEPHKIEWGTVDTLEHTPILDADERGDIVAHYATVHMASGAVLWNVISEGEAQALMRRMASKDRQGNVIGPWRDDYLPMARKTALRGLWRYMPKSPRLSLALSTDGTVREGVERDAAIIDTEATETEPTVVTQVVETDDERTERQLREQAEQAERERGE